MNLMRELEGKEWFTKSAPRVRTIIKGLVRKYPKHIKADIKWLDNYENLEKIENVEEVIRHPKERLFYTVVYVDKGEAGEEKHWHAWICS